MAELVLYFGSIAATRWLENETVQFEHAAYLTEAMSPIAAETTGVLAAGERWPAIDGWKDWGCMLEVLSDQLRGNGWYVEPVEAFHQR